MQQRGIWDLDHGKILMSEHEAQVHLFMFKILHIQMA